MHAVGRGLDIGIAQEIDLTSPRVRNGVPPALRGEIILIGVPVYGMGIPNVLDSFFTRLRGNHQPAVLIAVYGNVSAGSALLDLTDIAKKAGFPVVGAGAFIGEHTLSTPETPLAIGRPNSADLRLAEEFGRNIRRKLRQTGNVNEISCEIPRSPFPLLGRVIPRMRKILPRHNGTKTFSKTPVVDRYLCSHCGVCANLCPMGAIDRVTLAIDESQCLRCFCCVKRCPKKARKIMYRPKRLVAAVMTAKTKVEKKPKIYL